MSALKLETMRIMSGWFAFSRILKQHCLDVPDGISNDS